MTLTKPFKHAELLAQFLFVQTGSALSEWSGRLNKADQEFYLGVYFGRGIFHISGLRKTVRRTVRCGGEFRDYTEWADLG